MGDDRLIGNFHAAFAADLAGGTTKLETRQILKTVKDIRCCPEIQGGAANGNTVLLTQKW